MDKNEPNNLGSLLRRLRASIPMTISELSLRSGVSASHLGRIERGERFPSAHSLQRIAGHLGFEEGELFALAGYLSPQPSAAGEIAGNDVSKLDPVVSRLLSQEPVELQRTVLAILTMLKSVAKLL